MSTSFDNFVGRLDGARKSQTGNARVLQAFRAYCPVHQADGHKPGRTPSLSVAESTSGTVVMRCYAGCAPDEIVGAVGLSLNDLFPDADGRDMSTEESHSSSSLGEWRGLAARVDAIKDRAYELFLTYPSTLQSAQAYIDLNAALNDMSEHAKEMMRAERKRSAPAMKGGV